MQNQDLIKMKTHLDEKIRKLHCSSFGLKTPVLNPTIDHKSPVQSTKSDDETTRSSKRINSEHTSSSPCMTLEHGRPSDLSVPANESAANTEEKVQIDLLSNFNQFAQDALLGGAL